MIVYLDTSAFVNLFVEEVGSKQIEQIVIASQVVATSTVTFAETCAAFARRQRDGDLTPDEHQMVLASLDQYWGTVVTVEATMNVMRFAGILAARHALRGFDAIHLASALTLQTSLGTSVTFCCADTRLSRAAIDTGLQDISFT